MWGRPQHKSLKFNTSASSHLITMSLNQRIIRQVPSTLLHSIHRIINSKYTTAAIARSFSSFILSPKELHDSLERPSSKKPIPISAEWFLPNDPRKGMLEFTKLRIPGARFFDLDAVKDPDSPYPHMVPTGEVFAKAMREMGISRDDTVVLYDSPTQGLFSAPRAAWTFKVFGHPKVHLLNNFKQYVEEGYPTESGDIHTSKIESSNYPVIPPDQSMISSFEEIKQLAEDKAPNVQIIDARPGGRWKGIDPEPRPGLPSGHIPNSISLPFSSLIDPITKKLLPAPKLKEILLSVGVDPNENVEKRLMCGTGVTAVVLDLALDEAGIKGKRKVYDGSWTEWAMRLDEKSGLIVKD